MVREHQEQAGGNRWETQESARLEPLEVCILMANSTVRVMCPNLRCRAVLAVPGEARGRMVRCRNCGMNIMVPPKAADKPADKPKDEKAA